MVLPLSKKWCDWPKWVNEQTFQTPNFQFKCSLGDNASKTTRNEIRVLKDKDLIDAYRNLALDNDFQNILEIGFFQGAMPIFWADMGSPRKILAIDRDIPADELLALIRENDLSGVIEYVGGVDQGDTSRIRELVESRFGTAPLDLIIDDCSHLYDLTKGCFEQLFGYLRPGGKYVIEDWGWTHWPGEYWQSEQSQFHKTISMSNLIFEITMALASRGDLISNIEIVSGACVVVTRGTGLAHGDPMDLDKTINLAGGRTADLIS